MPQKSPGPSVKDPEQYEALRDQGASKEKAARIANSDRHVEREEGRQVRVLRGLDQGRPREARGRDRHRGRSKMNKGELIDALRNH